MNSRQRPRRALLFMPGDDEHKIAKGAALGADCVIMDLEDGVAPGRKEAARETVRRVLMDDVVDFDWTERLVRVNAAVTGLQEADIAATIVGRPDGYVLPKVESAMDIRRVSQLLLEKEHEHGIEPGSTRLLALIETAMGVVNLREIAGIDDMRLVALMFGAADLTTSLGARRTEGGQEVFYAKSKVVTYAAAFGLQAIDTPYFLLNDDVGLRAEAMAAMEMGYSGKMAIHPSQVMPIMQVFTPGEEEIDYAMRLMEAYREHERAGRGVFEFEGKMIDQPMITAAERVLSRAAIEFDGEDEAFDAEVEEEV